LFDGADLMDRDNGFNTQETLMTRGRRFQCSVA
jgi:hypothetical protein